MRIRTLLVALLVIGCTAHKPRVRVYDPSIDIELATARRPTAALTPVAHLAIADASTLALTAGIPDYPSVTINLAARVPAGESGIMYSCGDPVWIPRSAVGDAPVSLICGKAAQYVISIESRPNRVVHGAVLYADVNVTGGGPIVIPQPTATPPARRRAVTP